MVRSQSKGFTLIELLIVIAIIGILAAVTIPVLLRARISGNEASALGSVRTIVTAQANFQSTTRGYAVDLTTLSTPCPGFAVAFIGGDLGTNGITKSGYRFELAPGEGAIDGPDDCTGVPTQTTYYATAIPTSIGLTGVRAFATNVAATVWQNSEGEAPEEPFTVTATTTPAGK